MKIPAPLFYIGWALLLVGASLMLYSLEYFFDFYHVADTEYLSRRNMSFSDLFLRRDIDFWLAKQDKVRDNIWATALYLHIIGSLTPIVLGVFQFLPYLRKKYRAIHRRVGKIYVGAILFLGVPTGGYMAIFANGGKWASGGFFILTFLWAYTTFKAYHLAKNKEIPAHERWMTRSYAITFAAVMLRMWTDILSGGQWDVETVAVACAWLSWIPNMIVAELLIRIKGKALH